MAIPPRLLIPVAAAALTALAAVGWLMLPAGNAPDPMVPAQAQVDDISPELAEGDEAGLSDDEAADADTPVVIETDEGPMQADGAAPHDHSGDDTAIDTGDEADGGVEADAPGEVDETPLTEPTTTDPAIPPGDPIALPSGRQVWWADSAQDTQGPAGLTYRFRFVAPYIDPAMDAEQQKAVHEDMQALCDSFAVPRIARPGVVPGQIIITLMARAVGFGESDAAVTQFFEAFSLTAPEGRDPADPATPLTCNWEVY